MCLKSRFDLHSPIKRLTVVFENNTAACFVYTTMVHEEPAGLSEEVCSYEGADWLNSSVNQSKDTIASVKESLIRGDERSFQ